MSAFSILAPAKLNLCLHITGKRADGYHLLESVVAFTDMGDVLEVAPAEKLILTVTGEFAYALPEVSDDNLVLKAARLLQALSGTQQGAHITLHKHLPVGSGMGGGSADAAAALRVLTRLWDVQVDEEKLAGAMLGLGSDLPVCYQGLPCVMRGIGEDIAPLSLWGAEIHAVLVHPRRELLTSQVYGEFSGQFDATFEAPSQISSFEEFVAFLKPLHNSLEQPAIHWMSEIAHILKELNATTDCAIARMSGSGAGCFGIYDSALKAQIAAARIKKAHPEWWCVATQLEEE